MPTICATFSDVNAAAFAARRLRSRCDARDIRLHCPPPGQAGAVAPDLAARAETETPVMTFAAVMHDVEGECLLSAQVPPAAAERADAVLVDLGAGQVWWL